MDYINSNTGLLDPTLNAGIQLRLNSTEAAKSVEESISGLVPWVVSDQVAITQLIVEGPESPEIYSALARSCRMHESCVGITNWRLKSEVSTVTGNHYEVDSDATAD
jgi:hypothetical protein